MVGVREGQVWEEEEKEEEGWEEEVIVLAITIALYYNNQSCSSPFHGLQRKLQLPKLYLQMLQFQRRLPLVVLKQSMAVHRMLLLLFDRRCGFVVDGHSIVCGGDYLDGDWGLLL